MLYKLLFNYNGHGDFAQIMQQVYVFMAMNDVSFTFNGHNYSFSYWTCFLTTIVLSISVDIIVFGYHVIVRHINIG